MKTLTWCVGHYGTWLGIWKWATEHQSLPEEPRSPYRLWFGAIRTFTYCPWSMVRRGCSWQQAYALQWQAFRYLYVRPFVARWTGRFD